MPVGKSRYKTSFGTKNTDNSKNQTFRDYSKKDSTEIIQVPEEFKKHDNIEVSILNRYLNSDISIGTYFINLTKHCEDLKTCKDLKNFKNVEGLQNQALNKHLKYVPNINLIILIFSLILPYLAVFAVVYDTNNTDILTVVGFIIVVALGTICIKLKQYYVLAIVATVYLGFWVLDKNFGDTIGLLAFFSGFCLICIFYYIISKAYPQITELLGNLLSTTLLLVGISILTKLFLLICVFHSGVLNEPSTLLFIFGVDLLLIIYYVLFLKSPVKRLAKRFSRNIAISRYQLAKASVSFLNKKDSDAKETQDKVYAEISELKNELSIVKKEISATHYKTLTDHIIFIKKQLNSIEAQSLNSVTIKTIKDEISKINDIQNKNTTSFTKRKIQLDESMNDIEYIFELLDNIHKDIDCLKTTHLEQPKKQSKDIHPDNNKPLVITLNSIASVVKEKFTTKNAIVYKVEDIEKHKHTVIKRYGKRFREGTQKHNSVRNIGKLNDRGTPNLFLFDPAAKVICDHYITEIINGNPKHHKDLTKDSLMSLLKVKALDDYEILEKSTN